MTFSIKSLALGTLLATASMSPALAASILYPANGNLGTLTGGVNSTSSGFLASTSGEFDYLFYFDLTRLSNVSIVFTSSFTNSAQMVTDFTLNLFNGSTGSGPSIANATAVAGPSSVTGNLVDILKAGSFSFILHGTSMDAPTVGGTLSISVSTVPLPASLPMFGGALLALAGFGYGMNRWVAPQGKKAAPSA